MTSGVRDPERVDLLRAALEEEGLDALVCTAPQDVLLVSGYWPVIGTAIGLVGRSGAVAVAAPEDERHLAERGRIDTLRCFPAGGLDDLAGELERVRAALGECLHAVAGESGRLGWDAGAAMAPVPYVALHTYGPGLGDLLRQLAPEALLVPIGSLLWRLRARLTALERRQVRRACEVAEAAFRAGMATATPGMTESALAAEIRRELSTGALARGDVARGDGHVFCMSGPNSSRAFGSHAASSGRRIRGGDLVLVHCNSYVDGFWTDLTRTYVVGRVRARELEWYEAVFAARQAALDAVAPGTAAAEVDRAAREVLADRGLGEAFRHSTGHGVGFAAIDHQAAPRLHPASPDRLEAGMVCNIEPAVYLAGLGGIRHCDMVAVGPGGAELLTPFHATLDELVIG